MQAKGIAPAILYAAKSTEDKHGSIPDQLSKTRLLSQKENWDLSQEFSDEGFSAYSGNRGPGLEEAKEAAINLAAEHGECFLVALHSDRVARGAGDEPGAADHLVEVVAHLRRHGVRLRTVEDDFFADDRIGLLMAAVQGQRNTEDSRRKAESVRAGMKRRAERGMFSGPRPYGYEYAKDGSGLTIVPAEAEIVCRIFSEYVAGRSLSEISRRLHRDKVPTKTGALWRQSTVSGIVRNDVYVGKVTYRKKSLDGVHQPIIELDLWKRAAQLVASTPTKPGRPTKAKRHLFTGGFLRCGVCDEAMVPRTRPESGYEFYECNGRRLHGCTTGAIRRVDIDTGVLAHFEQTSLDIGATREAFIEAMDRQVAESRALLDAAEHEEQNAAARLAKVKRDYTHGDLTASEWRGLRTELEPEAAAAKAETERLREQVKAVTDDAALGDAEGEVLRQLSRIRSAVAGEITEASDVDSVRAALHRLFDRFILHPDLPQKAHVELVAERYWIEPVVSEQAVAGYDEKLRPILAKQPLEQAENNYAQAWPCRSTSGPP
jgi:DNA invertase Pin-like site-specific DNA recombinase